MPRKKRMKQLTRECKPMSSTTTEAVGIVKQVKMTVAFTFYSVLSQSVCNKGR